jgi:hypothetical protein
MPEETAGTRRVESGYRRDSPTPVPACFSDTIYRKGKPMPCNSTTTQSVALQNAMPEIVEKALTATGWNITGTGLNVILARKSGYSLTWNKGQGITIEGMRENQQAITAITKEYSKQAVSWAASRAGWQVQSTGSDTLTVTRR